VRALTYHVHILKRIQGKDVWGKTKETISGATEAAKEAAAAAKEKAKVCLCVCVCISLQHSVSE
jgi:hypothetical protein